MLEWAIPYAMSVGNERVVIYSVDHNHSDQLRQMLLELYKAKYFELGPLTQRAGWNYAFTFENGSEISISTYQPKWHTLAEAYAYTMGEVVLFDHWTIEKYFAPILAEWVRWDDR